MRKSFQKYDSTSITLTFVLEDTWAKQQRSVNFSLEFESMSCISSARESIIGNLNIRVMKLRRESALRVRLLSLIVVDPGGEARSRGPWLFSILNSQC